MTDDPTTDSTPAWFTPPEHGASAPRRSAPVQAPPSPPPVPADGFHITAPRVAADGFSVTRPGETFAVTPPNTSARPAAGSSVDFWPVGSPAQEAPAEPQAEDTPPPRSPLTPLTAAPPSSATALAPPTPLVRPIITITPASSPSAGASISVTPPAAPEPDDDGGRGWRVRAGHGSSSFEEPLKPAGILLDPRVGAEPAPFVMPAMSWDKQHHQRPTRRYVLFGAGLLALSGLAALALTTVGGLTHGIHQPQTIGGLARVDAPSVQTTLDSLDSYERSVGASNVVTGAYGAQGQTQMMLVVVQGSMLANGGTPLGVQSFVHGIVSGASSVGWTLDPLKITTTTVDGTTFECDEGPASANGGAVLSMCAWTDPGVAGAVVDMTGEPLTDVLNETVQARAASEH